MKETECEESVYGSAFALPAESTLLIPEIFHKLQKLVCAQFSGGDSTSYTSARLMTSALVSFYFYSFGLCWKLGFITGFKPTCQLLSGYLLHTKPCRYPRSDNHATSIPFVPIITYWDRIVRGKVVSQAKCSQKRQKSLNRVWYQEIHVSVFKYDQYISVASKAFALYKDFWVTFLPIYAHKYNKP